MRGRRDGREWFSGEARHRGLVGLAQGRVSPGGVDEGGIQVGVAHELAEAAERETGFEGLAGEEPVLSEAEGCGGVGGALLSG